MTSRRFFSRVITLIVCVPLDVHSLGMSQQTSSGVWRADNGDGTYTNPVLRSKNIFGPYEDKIVFDRGATGVNGPHQGGWVETQTGESWFVHFQEQGAYGRIIHLEPMEWVNDWPVIGSDPDGDGKGEPVGRWKEPDVRTTCSIAGPQTSDEFNSTTLGLQWQWPANHRDDWYSLTANQGALRLKTIGLPKKECTLWSVPNLLLQKFAAPEFSATARMMFHPSAVGEKAGLLVMGFDYSYIAVVKENDGLHLIKAVCNNADHARTESVEADIPLSGETVSLQVDVGRSALCGFKYSTDGTTFIPVGNLFSAREGAWIGAKVGLFCISLADSKKQGYADFNWFRVR